MTPSRGIVGAVAGRLGILGFAAAHVDAACYLYRPPSGCELLGLCGQLTRGTTQGDRLPIYKTPLRVRSDNADGAAQGGARVQGRWRRRSWWPRWWRRLWSWKWFHASSSLPTRSLKMIAPSRHSGLHSLFRSSQK